MADKHMEHSPSPASPDQVQHDIDADGGLYDQAVREDEQRARDNQREAYDSYKDNIAFTHRRERREAWEDVRTDMSEAWENAREKSKKTARMIGRAALAEVMPLATEFVQRRNANKRRSNRYKSAHKKQPLDERYSQEKQAFTGSVDDFKAIRREDQARAKAEKSTKQQQRADAAGYDTWEDYQDANRERAVRRRTNVRKAVKKSLPLWLSRS